MIVTDLFNFWAAKWDLTAQNTNSSFLGTMYLKSKLI